MQSQRRKQVRRPGVAILRPIGGGLLWFAIAASVGGPTAYAQGKSEGQAAKEKAAGKEFLAAQAAESANDFTTALAHYLRSYELAPSPETAYNIALNYERVEKFREAASYYQRYLDSAHDANDRAAIAANIARLRSRPGRVVVWAPTADSTIQIDDAAPATGPLRATLAGGNHHIVATDGARTVQQILNNDFGEPRELRLVYPAAQQGVISVWSTVPNTAISVDGKPSGQAPTSITVAAGRHVITATAPGYAPQTEQREIAPARGEQVSFVMQPGAAAADGTVEDAPSRYRFTYGAGLGAGLLLPSASLHFTFDPTVSLRSHRGEFFSAFRINSLSQLPPFCLGYRYGKFRDGGATPTAAVALAVGAGAAVEARVGIVWVNAVEGTTKADIALEAGLGLGRDLPTTINTNATQWYVPVALSFMLHQ